MIVLPMVTSLLILLPALAFTLTLFWLGVRKIRKDAISNEAPARQVLDRGYQWNTDREVHRSIGFFPKDTCGIVWDPVKQEFEYPDTEWPDWMVMMVEHELMIAGHEKYCFQCKGGWRGRARGTA